MSLLKALKKHIYYKVRMKGWVKVTREDLLELIEYRKDYSNVDVSEITDFSYLFLGRNVMFDVSGWDVSNALNMKGMFAYSNYNKPLNDWNVSNVLNMEAVFSHSKYNHPLNNWNVSNVTNMSCMFTNSDYNHPLNKWDISNVQNMTGMFLESSYNHPLNNWNVSNVREMTKMFSQSMYNQPLNKWNTQKVRSTYGMFLNSNFNHSIESWNLENLIDSYAMFASTKTDLISAPLIIHTLKTEKRNSLFYVGAYSFCEKEGSLYIYTKNKKFCLDILFLDKLFKYKEVLKLSNDLLELNFLDTRISFNYNLDFNKKTELIKFKLDEDQDLFYCFLKNGEKLLFEKEEGDFKQLEILEEKSTR